MNLHYIIQFVFLEFSGRNDRLEPSFSRFGQRNVRGIYRTYTDKFVKLKVISKSNVKKTRITATTALSLP
jgi:hypothetical protein